METAAIAGEILLASASPPLPPGTSRRVIFGVVLPAAPNTAAASLMATASLASQASRSSAVAAAKTNGASATPARGIKRKACGRCSSGPCVDSTRS